MAAGKPRVPLMASVSIEVVHSLETLALGSDLARSRYLGYLIETHPLVIAANKVKGTK